MKKEFPFYKSSLNGKRVNPSALIEERLNSSDKKILKDFLLFCSINSSGKKRAENYKRVMLQFKDFLEKELSKVNNKDFLHFAETIKRSERTTNGKNDVRDVIKKFGYWIGDQKEIKFSNLKLIKFEKTQGSNKIKSPNDLITELEFDKLIRSTSNLMHKTLICLLWESAGRPEEVLKLRWNDIDFIKNNVKLHSSKTGIFRITQYKEDIKNEIENYLIKLKNYDNLGHVSSIKPPNTSLLIELTTAGEMYCVSSQSDLNIKLYYTANKALSWTQLDVDPSNTSGDNKSRDHKISAAWHDPTNSIIHFVDCDNDGTADDYDVWKLDYTSSKSAPTVTEIGSDSGAVANSLFIWDIFKIGSDYFIIGKRSNLIVVHKVTVAPFVVQDTLAEGDIQNDFTYGIIVGNIYYSVVTDNTVRLNILDYDHNITTIAISASSGSIHPGVDFLLPASRNQHGVAYDGLNILYCIGLRKSDSKTFLFNYSISGDSWVLGGQYDVAIMLDRNAASGVLEKAFHLSEARVYQIDVKQITQLYLISNVSPSQSNWNAITDTYLQDIGGGMFEYKDFTSKIYDAEIAHGRMNTPFTNLVMSDEIKVEAGMFIQITDQYT
ncbi:hypothetical protein LCGC14_1790840, partial [marine sediment metagenome]